ncbi:BrnA antitoxin family protein [Nostoc favosum]|uniref:BrnA antitoxin family protein n=1 Tax=Nostoc favosum CHAB5714 TaxID=2780399 RepID=A0ABS8IKH7_9NOSO|nr:BrnA antitoxin family protein [Nostoc favosum]MCC5604364.1 BrnA antitoxin family protein [Nostoc favosum CHAB5714]
MSNSFSFKASQTDWERIEAMQDEDIDLSEIPEVTEEQMKQAVLRVGGKPVERSQRHIDILLDAFIVEYFKSKAGEQGYQVLINQALTEYILAKTVDLPVSEVNENIPD